MKLNSYFALFLLVFAFLFSLACGGGGGGSGSSSSDSSTDGTNFRFKADDGQKYAGTWYATSVLFDGASYLPTSIREVKLIVNESGRWELQLRIPDEFGVISTLLSSSENQTGDDYEIISFDYSENNNSISITEVYRDKAENSQHSIALTMIKEGLVPELAGTYDLTSASLNGTAIDLSAYESWWLSIDTEGNGFQSIRNATTSELIQDSLFIHARDGLLFIQYTNSENETGSYSLSGNLLEVVVIDHEGDSVSETFVKRD